MYKVHFSKCKLLLVPVSLMFLLFHSCHNVNKLDTYQKYDDFKTINVDFKITSKAVKNGELLPAYQCEEKTNDIENSIPLSWSNVPKGTKSLAIIMYHYPKKDDKSEVNSYLILWNIPPSVNSIPYKMANNTNWFMGSNKDKTAISYTSPCSKGPGKHEYTIALFALSEALKSLPKSNSLAVDYNVFMKAISQAKIIDRTALSFTVSRE